MKKEDQNLTIDSEGLDRSQKNNEDIRIASKGLSLEEAYAMIGGFSYF